MAKNITSLQLLRNTSQLYATREAALAALSSATVPAGTNDGTPVLARYKGNDGKIYTLVGFYAIASGITGGTETGLTNMTIFDYEGQAGDVETLRQEINAKLGTGITSADTATSQLTTLSGTNADNSGATSVWGAKKYTDDKIKTLDSAGITKDDNKVVVSFSETDGIVTGQSVNITEVKLAGYAEAAATGDVATTDTLGEALGKLQKTIHSMDKTASAVAGQVVTTVDETDGVVTETKANVKDLQLGGYAKDTSATGDVASTDTINTAISKIENTIAANKIVNTDNSINVVTASTATTISVKIKNDANNQIKLDSTNGVYTNLYLSAITPSSTNVKEEYALFNDGVQVTTATSSTIKIYKDSAYKEIYLGTSGDTINPTTGEITKLSGDKQSLNYAYMKADGTYDLVKVDVSAFLNENEFASGVTATDHIVHGVVDPTSEKVVLTYNADGTTATTGTVLTVGANGFKVDNIQTAIDAKVNSAISLLDATQSGGATAGTATSNHVKVTVDEADGKITAVTVNETNIANKSDLDALSAKTYTVATSTNNSITATESTASDGTTSIDIITDASKIKMSGFTPDESGFTAITEASSITEAFKAVETFVLDNEEVISAALNDLETRKADKVDLDAEIAARKAVDGQNGQTYVANSGKKYISGATSLNDADIKLNDALENITTGWIKDVKVNGTPLPETDNVVNVQISAANEAANSANSIVIEQNSTSGALTFKLGTLDAGTY